MKDPERLLTGGDDLSKLVSAAHDDVLDADRVKNVRRNLEAAGAFAPVAGGKAILGSTAVKIAALLAPAGIIIAGAIYYAGHTSAPSAPVRTAPSSPVAEPSTPVVIVAPPEPTPTQHTEETPPAKPTNTIPHAAAPAPTGTSPREGLLLLQARQALANDPQRALDLVRTHEREFPKSQLTPERNTLRADAIAHGAH